MSDNKEPVVLQENNFFDTKESLDEVMDYMTAYAGKDNAWFCAMTMAFTLNALVRMMHEQGDGTCIGKRAKTLMEETA
tara:strand:- start:210 stop:443 length:234 start_codon:yes stop_codon:yes gene_type:complete